MSDDQETKTTGREPDPGWIAGYRIIRKLGEGGMGIIYEAEQQNPRRSVAIKIVRPASLADERRVSLFKREAQTLGRLMHPSIAAIYEAGQTEDGRQYIAMELVRGATIDRWQAARESRQARTQTEIRERLQLFLRICDAIAYAHQRGIIHRDIKPSNVLVVQGEPASGGAGSPEDPMIKVLDFGVAYLTDPNAMLSSFGADEGVMRGTLPYMSPEQLTRNPDEIDFRSDIYSLGVLLFEFLTGELPYTVRRTTIADSIRAICTTPPQRPNLLVPALKGDLEAILLKTLEKAPPLRYQSAVALSEDIRRYLNHQAVLARPPSAWDQARMLVLRHRVASGFVGILFALLLAFGVTMSVMFEQQKRERLRADRARQTAIEETQKVAKINDFLQKMLSSINPEESLGGEVTVRAVLDKAAEGAGTELAGHPEIQASVRSTIGRAYMALGAYESAETLLRASLETRRRILGEVHADVVQSCLDLGMLLQKEGKYAEAEPLFRRVLSVAQELYGPENEMVAEGMNSLALVLRDEGKYDEAEALFRQTVDMVRKILGEKHPAMATCLNNLGLVLLNLGRPEEAESLFRDAIARDRELNRGNHPDLAKSLNNLGLALRDQRRFEEAEAVGREALALRKRILGVEHPYVATDLTNLASLLTQQKRFREAEPLFQEGLAMERKLLGREHPYIAKTLDDLASFCHEQGRDAEAEAYYRQALEMRRKLLGPTHPVVSNSLWGIGTIYLARNDAAAAEPVLRECLAVRRRAYPATDARVALAANALGASLDLLGRHAEADSLLRESLPVLRVSPTVSTAQKEEALRRIIRHCQTTGRSDLADGYRSELRQLGRP